LNTWTDQPSAAGAHYGQAYRFMSYLGGRYDPEIMAEIISAPGTGLNAVDHALRARGADLQTVYADWLAANLFVQDGSGPLSYERQMTPVEASPAGDGFSTRTTVSQWGADYYRLQDNAPQIVKFQGAPRVRLVSNDPKSGTYQWYSNRGDLLNSTLTRELDLSAVERATLEIDLWYDIEEHFDYAYIEISNDGGETWKALAGGRTTNDNPNGNNLGNGLTGQSGGWVTEQFDLSSYAGKRVLLRVEYVTDDGYNAQGIAVDGVRVPEMGFSDDSEASDGWIDEGWVRTNNVVPGRYRLLVLDPDNAGTYSEIPVGADGRATVVLPQGRDETPVIAVSGAAQTTTQPSEYTLRLEEPGAGLLGILGGRAEAENQR
ncbi:MAG: immune inhibitor A, partial [Chloroflexota bacterium]|nr:immune inhibitor A [Chloroflexota bacterium]